jgi:hypothetical protein
MDLWTDDEVRNTLKESRLKVVRSWISLYAHDTTGHLQIPYILIGYRAILAVYLSRNSVRHVYYVPSDGIVNQVVSLFVDVNSGWYFSTGYIELIG